MKADFGLIRFDNKSVGMMAGTSFKRIAEGHWTTWR
jgi:hypothetical protein